MSLAGDVGMSELAVLTEHCRKALERSPKLIVLDLSGVTMIASAGMGAMVALRRDAGKLGCQVRLAAIRPQVKEALKRALFDRIFQMFDTVDQAFVAT